MSKPSQLRRICWNHVRFQWDHLWRASARGVGVKELSRTARAMQGIARETCVHGLVAFGQC